MPGGHRHPVLGDEAAGRTVDGGPEAEVQVQRLNTSKFLTTGQLLRGDAEVLLARHKEDQKEMDQVCFLVAHAYD